MRRVLPWAIRGSVFFLAVLAAGCMTSPLNKDLLKTQNQPVLFDGYHVTPQREIRVFLKNQKTAAFDEIGKVQVSSVDPKKDSKGQLWYKWSMTLVLPSDPKYWALDANKTELFANVKSTDGNNALTSFEQGADQCWTAQARLNKGGFEIMGACQSASTPVVKLRTPCGGVGQPVCCQAAADCGSGKVCTGGKCVSGCGGAGQPCCGSTCSTGLACQSGKCVACGQSGQPCCGNACDFTSLVCKNGKCSSCGGLGQLCCTSGKPCKSTSWTCQSGFCAAAPPQPTCAPFGSSCDASTCCAAGTQCTNTGLGSTGRQCCHSGGPGVCN